MMVSVVSLPAGSAACTDASAELSSASTNMRFNMIFL